MYLFYTNSRYCLKLYKGGQHRGRHSLVQFYLYMGVVNMGVAWLDVFMPVGVPWQGEKANNYTIVITFTHNVTHFQNIQV